MVTYRDIIKGNNESSVLNSISVYMIWESRKLREINFDGIMMSMVFENYLILKYFPTNTIETLWWKRFSRLNNSIGTFFYRSPIILLHNTKIL